MLQVFFVFPAVTVITAFPPLIPFTTPYWSTVATAVFEEE